ncbi:MAG: MFS transporter [Thermodesulfobacteriota bacterium]|nr:MFS transporter [Thermodesulfobacteriota bacterium]
MEGVQNSGDSKKEITSHSFLRYAGPLFFLVGIFFINFLSRIILSPLMPTVEKDLKIGHDEAGSLFFLISLGYCLGMLTSGFISSRFKHRRTIIFSSFAAGGALLWVSFSSNLWGIRLGLLIMGIAAGFYLPSGIATLTELVPPRHLGKAFAIHELAPNLGFILAPILTEFLLEWCLWQSVLTIIGMASLSVGLIFVLRGKGGNFPGEAPNLGILKNILKEPSLWVMMVFFSLGVGSTVGVYLIIPLYLVAEKGMDQTWANTLLALSRISILATVFLAGWVIDRLGVKKALKAVFLTTGLVTAMLGIVSGSWIVLVIFLQPILAASFFPAGFIALTKIRSPQIKNVAVSLTVPLGFFIGGGAITAGLGLLGEAGLFFLGFILFGGLLFAGAALTRYLDLDENQR